MAFYAKTFSFNLRNKTMFSTKEAWPIKSVSIYFQLRFVHLICKQWRAEGGANGATALGIQDRGPSKERNYRNENIVTRCFLLLQGYYHVLRGFNFSKLVFLRIEMSVILTFLVSTLGVRHPAVYFSARLLFNDIRAA